MIGWLFFAEALVTNLFSGESFQRSHVGLYVRNIETGEEIISENAEAYFIPASVEKLVTGWSALVLLGEEFSFETRVSYTGEIDTNGVLRGDLWVHGGGDPSLPFEALDEWEKEIRKVGIRSIEGTLYIDTSSFEAALASPYWMFEDLGNYFGAGASGLSIHRNSFEIIFEPGNEVGSPARVVGIDPPIPQLIVQNEVTTGPAGSGDGVTVFGVEYSPLQVYRGTVPFGVSQFRVKAALFDPAQFCGEILQSHLQAKGGVEYVRSPREAGGEEHLICHRSSPPLSSLLREMNRESLNLYAEHLLKAIGGGRADLGRRRIEGLLRDGNIPCVIRDGAGIARNNLLTPKGVVDLLCRARKSPLFDSLPRPGEGTLAKVLPIAYADVRAKSGSMGQIYNLAGYLTVELGDEFAFALFCNHYDGPLHEVREEMHALLESIVEQNLFSEE